MFLAWLPDQDTGSAIQRILSHAHTLTYVQYRERYRESCVCERERQCVCVCVCVCVCEREREREREKERERLTRDPDYSTLSGGLASVGSVHERRRSHSRVLGPTHLSVSISRSSQLVSPSLSLFLSLTELTTASRSYDALSYTTDVKGSELAGETAGRALGRGQPDVVSGKRRRKCRNIRNFRGLSN